MKPLDLAAAAHVAENIGAREPRTIDRAESTLTLLLIWGFLTFLCCLAAHAVYDYNERVQAQLQSAHTAGMALGAAMCERASK